MNRTYDSSPRLTRLQLTALLTSVVTAIAVLAFASGAYFDRHFLVEAGNSRPREVSSLSTDTDSGFPLLEFSRLEKVARLIESEYYLMPGDQEAIESFWKALEEKAIQGLTVGLDGHSAYLIPSDSAAAADSLSGTYEGIGVWISHESGSLLIVAPVPGSPAEKAGIRAGDIIVEIDDIATEGMDDNSAVDALIGPAGESVNLRIRRPSTDQMLEFDIVRERINYPVVKYRFDEQSRVAIIQITIFGDRTVAELDTALGLAKDDGAVGIVLDLRNNGGGWVQSAQETIGRFLPEATGPALYEDFDPLVDGDERAEPVIEGDVQEFGLPMVVLVNQGTASASEIVAGALGDYQRATIIGERTFGKGSVQRVHEFDDGASLRLTFAHWLTPRMRTIEGEGLMPDLEVIQVDDAANVDEQMVAALEQISEMVLSAA